MISVIVTHHLTENEPYLKACLNALTQSVIDTEFEIICVSDAEKQPDNMPGVKLCWTRRLYNSTKKVNFAIGNLVDDRSTHYFFVSDDVMVTSYTMSALYQTAIATNAIVIPMSNSDNGSCYMTDITIAGRNIGQNITLKDIEGIEHEILSTVGGKSFIIEREWVSFFAPMISRDIWMKVGGLDADLDCRFNDQDFCLRAKRLGISRVIQLAAFAIHFGSKTLSHNLNRRADEEKAAAHFIKKWPGQLG